jgi:hypothetical protein
MMKPPRKTNTNSDWAARQLNGTPVTKPAIERRQRMERRSRRFWAIWYGGFRPRRRAPTRRADDSRFHVLDWYSAHLFAVALGILVLSASDAFLTLRLLRGGADEVNPVMALLVYRDVSVFTAIKMALTGSSVVTMVLLSRYRFMRFLRVELVLYAVLAGYIALISYEWWLLNENFDPLAFV